MERFEERLKGLEEVRGFVIVLLGGLVNSLSIRYGLSEQVEESCLKDDMPLNIYFKLSSKKCLYKFIFYFKEIKVSLRMIVLQLLSPYNGLFFYLKHQFKMY